MQMQRAQYTTEYYISIVDGGAPSKIRGIECVYRLRGGHRIVVKPILIVNGDLLNIGTEVIDVECPWLPAGKGESAEG